eukprot:SAG31_NODE_10135_length_1179_cov_1.191667_2_plen_168_part_01
MFHAWTQNLGRHNHGSTYFNDPWSGYYELGAPFWAQAQITQLVEIGWMMLPKGLGSGHCETQGGDLAYVTFASPTQKDFTIVIRGPAQALTTNVSFVIKPALPKYSVLHVWMTTRYHPFEHAGTIQPFNGGQIDVAVPAAAVVSISTIADARRVVYKVPSRSSFPLPY